MARPQPAGRGVLACGRLTAVLVLAVALTLLAGAVRSAGAASRSGRRVTVALFGDSVTESYLVPDFLRDGLAPQLARAEAPFGFTPGGGGLIPAAPYRWHFNRWVVAGTGPLPRNGWLTVGYGLTPGFDGPSAYSAIAASPSARATARVSDPQIEVLYTSTSLHCPFTVSAAGREWSIDPFRAGPAVDTQTTLELPAGTHLLTVHGPSCGYLSFDGVVAHRPVAPGAVQVEVDNLGHSGKLPWVDFTPRVRQSLADQRYDVSVFLFGYVGELGAARSLAAPYVAVMAARAAIARAHGGSCLIVQPTPIAVPAAAVSLVSRLDRSVARRAGCSYTTALAHLWSSADTAERAGLLLVDGVHPTAAGYARVSRALAPVVARLVRARLHLG